ncbi:MAG TPA: glutamyl-tRNA reductase [Anaerolineae bacterium]|nr:glutamyl-tRNA reductase [Anaerolineae bacterium]HMR66009.1 glutamyl-tRNA reductase [Anaerolineae bacterium]
MRILLIGLSHKTTPVDIRERLAFPATARRSALTHFDHTHHQEAHLPEVKEGVILSTCNRLEIYALVGDTTIASQVIIEFLSQAGGIPTAEFVEHLYIHQDEQAVHHLMQVACGLDSLVLGEPQILGQITEAYEAALGQRAAGPVLSALFRAAIHTGKRARTETSISANAASISSVAANLAEQLLGDLSQRRVLLIGAGEMGAIAVRSLLKRGVTDITVVNRTYEKAVEMAEPWGGQVASFQQLPAAINQVDIVITSTSAPHTILDKSYLSEAFTDRTQRPLFIIDIAVPRDVDPNVSDLPGVHLYNIDDLQQQAEDNVREREAEIPRVETMIAAELTNFMNWLNSLGAVSTITAMRHRAEELRQMELDRLFSRLELTERQQELIATMSHRLVNKILHQPTIRLKEEAANGNGVAYISALRQLFALDQVA